MISPGERKLRHRQAVGLVWVALAILIFCIWRAGLHAVFLPHWWNWW